MFLNRAKGALPEYSQQQERGQTDMNGRPRHTLIIRPGSEQMHQYQIEMGKGTGRHCNEPIIQEPDSPPYEDLGAQSNEEFEQEYDDGGDNNIEDYDEMIDLRSMQQTENAAIEQEHGKEIISSQSSVPSTPMIKRYNLRTEYTAYERIS